MRKTYEILSSLLFLAITVIMIVKTTIAYTDGVISFNQFDTICVIITWGIAFFLGKILQWILKLILTSVEAWK